MFNSVGARFALRVVVVGIIAGLAVLKSTAGDGLSTTDIIDVIATAFGASAAYAGIGAAVPAVEPSIGAKPDAPPPAE